MKTIMSLCLLWGVLLVAAPDAKNEADPASKFGKAEIIVKDRNLATALVRDGKPAAAIVGDAALAAKVNEALKRLAGSELPVLPHSAYENAENLDRNLIVLGNRDRNRTVSNLYNRHFALLDARYPGKGGSEVRSLHNPFGDKFNVILVGGSDAAGDAAAVDKLIGHLEKAGGKPGELTLGFLSDVTLSPDYVVARDVKDIPLWEESAGYGNKGYFGWNSLAKNLAMLYITNDPYYKDEFMITKMNSCAWLFPRTKPRRTNSSPVTTNPMMTTPSRLSRSITIAVPSCFSTGTWSMRIRSSPMPSASR
jgi:hypothetical protein